jgi:hypothetical protein
LPVGPGYIIYRMCKRVEGMGGGDGAWVRHLDAFATAQKVDAGRDRSGVRATPWREMHDSY